eukprot:Sspe_Gene.55703::Locus_30636_Transcript_1_1_Confidence_1.000_Length_910::g.55703::m.55703
MRCATAQGMRRALGAICKVGVRHASTAPRHAARLERIDHVAVGVRSIQDSLPWYKGVLGMTPYLADNPLFRSDDLAMVKGGEAVVALLRIPDGKTGLPGTREQKGHVAFRVSVDEVRRLAKELPELLLAHRVHDEQSTEILLDDYSLQLSIFFYDPSGNEVEVTAWVDPNDPVRFG